MQDEVSNMTREVLTRGDDCDRIRDPSNRERVIVARSTDPNSRRMTSNGGDRMLQTAGITGGDARASKRLHLMNTITAGNPTMHDSIISGRGPKRSVQVKTLKFGVTGPVSDTNSPTKGSAASAFSPGS